MNPGLVEITRGIFQAFSSSDLEAHIRGGSPSGRPVGSTGRVEWRFAALGIWADGLIVRVITYSDIHEAREAAERLVENSG